MATSIIVSSHYHRLAALGQINLNSGLTAIIMNGGSTAPFTFDPDAHVYLGPAKWHGNLDRESDATSYTRKDITCASGGVHARCDTVTDKVYLDLADFLWSSITTSANRPAAGILLVGASTNDAALASLYDAWEASVAYALDKLVTPTVENGRIYRCVANGTSYSSEPTWATPGYGNLTSEAVYSTVQWVDQGYDRSPYPVWKPNTAYSAGSFVRPTTPNNYAYRCTVGGTSHGSTEPTWNTSSDTVDITDNTATWRRCLDANLPIVAYLSFGQDEVRSSQDLAVKLDATSGLFVVDF